MWLVGPATLFRFTIRELVLLTLVVAMGVGWWVERSNRPGPWSVIVPDSVVALEGLHAGDKLEYELLPNGSIEKRIIRGHAEAQGLKVLPRGP
jgi:hypothetical protein